MASILCSTLRWTGKSTPLWSRQKMSDSNTFNVNVQPVQHAYQIHDDISMAHMFTVAIVETCIRLNLDALSPNCTNQFPLIWMSFPFLCQNTFSNGPFSAGSNSTHTPTKKAQNYKESSKPFSSPFIVFYSRHDKDCSCVIKQLSIRICYFDVLERFVCVSFAFIPASAFVRTLLFGFMTDDRV